MMEQHIHRLMLADDAIIALYFARDEQAITEPIANTANIYKKSPIPSSETKATAKSVATIHT